MPGWREKFKASSRGEVSREGLDPYRAAGSSVYSYILDLDEMRFDAATQPNIQIALLAGWNAFALQSLGDKMLDADAEYDPATAGFVPPVTAEQAMAFYEPVQGWMSRARAAQANPSYKLDAELPEVLPEWVEVEPCPPAHLLALREAVDQLRRHTESVLSGFDPGGSYAHARDIVAQGTAEAASAAEYANGLWGAATATPPARMHEAIEANLKHAAEAYFYLGQVIAMPSLADAPRRVRAEPQPEDQTRAPSFLQTMVQAYPQVAGRRRSGGFGGGLAGGLLGGLLGGGIAGELFGGGGGGGWGDNDGGGWGDNGGGGWDNGGGGGGGGDDGGGLF